ncbi:hypothetical protein [Streptacidiphilus carbonis]|jgi:hypothetical protein|uniref:hypothetical protein n=1 Tax=Streptacidiphilus carbonis TaxID=105422 RepID=UPI001269D5B8|nr:hypothetical protein [Streptacidiphilus carbonis]
MSETTVFIGMLDASQSSRQVSASTPGGIPAVRACASRREAEEFLGQLGLAVDLDDEDRVSWDGDRGVWPVGP